MDDALIPTLKSDQLALLEFDNLILGFPQSQVLTIESLSNIKSNRPSEKSSGEVLFGSEELPVYTFDHDLSLQDQPTSNNRFCIVIKHDENNESFAVMCDAISQYSIDDKTSINDIPHLMKTPGSPVIGLVKKNDALVLVSTAESMRSYINSQVEV